MSVAIDEIERSYYSSGIEKLEDQIVASYSETPAGTAGRARAAFLHGALLERADLVRAREYYQEAHAIAVGLGDRRILADTLHAIANDALRTHDLKTANRLEEEALGFATECGHLYRIAHCNFMLGTVALKYGSDEQGIALLTHSLQISLQEGFQVLQLRLFSNLAELYLQSADPARARVNAEKSLRTAYALGQTREILVASIRLATIKLELKEYGEVSKLVTEVRKTLPKENRSLWCVTHTLIGKVHEAKRRYEQAEVEFKIAIKLADYPNAERVRSNVHVHLALLYLKVKKPRPALKEAMAALADAETAQDIYVRKEALRAVHDAYKALNKYKEAHEYLERYNALVAESDTALLKSRLEYHALKSDFEQEKAKADMQTQQTELLRIKLEYKERELTEKMRHLITQAEAVRQFRNDLRSLLRRTPSDDPAAKDIRSRMSTFTENDIQWQEFEEKFREAFPDFREKLKAKHPDLTGQELRLCQLLRAGLKSVEAAKLMIISERGVEQHRLRVRRKVGLKGKESLTEYLQQL